MREGLGNEHGVEILQVGKADKLGDVGLVADVAAFLGGFVAPLGGGFAEEGEVEHVGFAGVNEGGLGLA